MKEHYNWGIIGPGKIAGKFAQALALSERAQLYTVASRSHQRAEAFAQQYGALRTHTSYEALVQDPEVDVIYIATPHPFHHAQSLLCLEAGKAVLCEKPMGINAREVREMQQKAKDKEVFLMEAIWTRFHPNILKALEWIKEGKIGEVKLLRADFGFLSPFNPNSRLYKLELGGGSLLDIGIYPLFLAQLLFGKPLDIQAKAELSPTGSDNWCAMQIEYEGGKIAQIHSTVTFDTNVDAEIYGTQAKIHLPTRWHNPGPVRLYHRQDCLEAVEYPRDLGYFYEIEAVMKSLDEGRIENELLPHSFSLQLAETMDEIRKQCGVVYPQDS